MSEEKYTKAPAIVGKAKEEPKPYHIRDRKNAGATTECFIGRCPKKGERYQDTIRNHSLPDDQIVNLTEREVDHLKNLGQRKNEIIADERGCRRPSGRTYLDARFELNPV